MTAHGQRIRLRMFLEGVEVPIIGIQYNGLPNAPVMAAIQVPPVAEGTRLLPRTLVHVFFLDSYVDDSPYIATKSASTKTTGQKDPTAYQQGLQSSGTNTTQGNANSTDSGEDLTKYKLLFGGEIVGFQWSKDQSQRSLVLQCVDWSNYWDYAYQWNNTDLFGPGLKAMFSGGSTNLFTDFLSNPGEVITNILRTPSVTFPKLKGLAGGIVHLIESIGGTYYGEKKFAGTNTFFTTAELRLHINQMVVAYEDDPTAARLLANQGYGGLFNRLLGGLGGQTSIRQCINALQGVIFHEIYAQPSPKYIPGADGAVGKQNTARLADGVNTAFIAANANASISELNLVKSLITNQDDQPTGSTANPRSKTSLSMRLRKEQSFLKSTAIRANRVDPPVASAVALLTTAAQYVGLAGTSVLGWAPTNFSLTVKILNDLDNAIAKLTKLADLTVSITPKAQQLPPRLVSHILRPDVWFSAPPCCNVIFPEQYNRLQYNRSFLEEPTRLLLKTNDEFFGEDELFDRFYFAPKTSSVQKGKANLTTLLQNDLLAHEVFTGILPVFEKMGELNIFAARGGIAKDKVPQVGLAQRSANFLYFKYRFAARQMTVTGRFNPYIAMGFPGLVIDKHVSIDTLGLYNDLLKKAGQPTRDINRLLGTAFLGNFTQCTASVNQSAATMDIVLAYPRQPDESVEFLGATDLAEVIVSKRIDKDASRTTDVASIAQPAIQALGPNLGTITAVQEVTSLYLNMPDGDPTASMSTKPLMLWGTTSPDKPQPASSRTTARVPIGIEIDPKILSQSVRVGLGLTTAQGKTPKTGASAPVTIRVFRLTEAVPRYQQQPVALPAEEYIRPGWYGDIWHPAKIGQAYQLFFSTGAITDPSVIVDPNGGTFSGTPNAGADALATGQQTNDPNNPTSTAPIAWQLTEGASIEQAAAFLQATYSYIKTAGLNVEEFIRAYTWRPIATLIDMFGTGDLQLSADGNTVVQGIEGFHSRAFGPYSDLFGLVTPEIESITGIKRGTSAAQKVDTRGQKQAAVQDYLAGLGIGKAILG